MDSHSHGAVAFQCAHSIDVNWHGLSRRASISRAPHTGASARHESGLFRRSVVSMSGGGRKPMPPEARAAASRGENVKYWRGEWICVDCGYIYKPGRKVKFEDLPSTWKCPQCNAPKRRFAKKAGSVIQETEGTSNVPIIVFSVLGLIATIAFGIWANSSL